jgi:hypothetical protein
MADLRAMTPRQAHYKPSNLQRRRMIPWRKPVMARVQGGRPFSRRKARARLPAKVHELDIIARLDRHGRGPPPQV